MRKCDSSNLSFSCLLLFFLPLSFYSAHPLNEGWDVWGTRKRWDSGPAAGSILHLLPFLSHRAENYLYNRRAWSICLEPEGIVTWHIVLFSLLLLISVAEMVLALLQILNGCLGCLCGFCDGK